MPEQAQLMSPPNATWREIIAQAAAQPDVLKQPGRTYTDVPACVPYRRS